MKNSSAKDKKIMTEAHDQVEGDNLELVKVKIRAIGSNLKKS